MAQDTTQLPPELQAEIKQVEGEVSGLEAMLADERGVGEQIGFEKGCRITAARVDAVTGCAPLPYVRELLAMLKDAWVEDYQDGPLRIHRDIEGLRGHVQATQAPPERQW